MNEDCLVFRAESGKLTMTEPYCSHFGVNMATGKVVGDDIRCPMHGRMFRGDGAEGPLNDYLISKTGQNVAHLCNFLTVMDGKRCKLTQIGIGRRSLNPLTRFQDMVGAFFSWNATREDAPIWNNRKPVEPDYHPHNTDKAIKAFCEWVDTFQYVPGQDGSQPDVEHGVRLKIVQSG